ncbi:MAG: hypothetical protein RBQ76_05000 [Sulfurovum sp.]|nr:hypothetical protein [Sulfurovum sp.]
MNQLKTLYTNSPLWLKKLYASIPYEIRNGTDYRKWKKFLEKEINTEEYQLLKLKETIFYAYENTLFYKNVFDQLGCNIHDFNDLKDVEMLPLIDKDTVREYYDDMIAKSYPQKKTFFVTTGGSSGEPMQFLQSKNVWNKEWAFGFNLFSKYGYFPKMLKASFRGGDFTGLKKDIYWKYNPMHHELHFSPFALNFDTVKFYVNELNMQQPLVYHSYPSSLLLLINCMQEMNLVLDYRPRLIILISENYSKIDIETINHFFQCQVISFYGHSEHLIFAPTIDKELAQYQIDKRYGFCELVDSENKTITHNLTKGELVGTSFDNFAMPLIRYKTNDYASYIDYENAVIGTIEGRWKQEFLDGYNGSKIYLTALNMHSDIFTNVVQFQFIQKVVGQVDFLVIPKSEFKTIDEENILKAFRNKVDNAIEFNLIKVNKLVLTERGKVKKIIKEYNK